MIVTGVWMALIVLTASATYLSLRRRPLPLRRVAGVAAAVFLILATLLGHRETARLEWYLATARWPAVTGKVISASVIGKRAFVPKVTYTYQVGDSLYTATTDLEVPGFGTRSNRLDVAEKSIADYAPDALVTVHYDPNNPGISRLKASVPWNVYVRLSTAVFASLIGVVVLVVSLLGRRRPEYS